MPRSAPCSTRSRDLWRRSPPTAPTTRRALPPPSPSVILRRRSSCRHGPRRCRARRPRPTPRSGTVTCKASNQEVRRACQARTRSLAENIRLHEAGSGQGGHRQVQAGHRRRAALAHGPTPSDRGGRGRPCAQPYAGTRTPDFRPHRLNHSRGWGNCARIPGPCNNVGRAASLTQAGVECRPVRHPVPLGRNVMTAALVQLERQNGHPGLEGTTPSRHPAHQHQCPIHAPR